LNLIHIIYSFHPKIVDILVWIRKFRRKKSKNIWHTETNKERDIDALKKIKYIFGEEKYTLENENDNYFKTNLNPTMPTILRRKEYN
jgi:hypothetical protein